MKLKGRLFDGKTSKSHDAYLIFDELGNVTSLPDIISKTPFMECKISSRLGNTPRAITFPTGEIFESVDHDDFNRINQHFGGQETWVHKLESNTQYVVFMLAFLVAFITWSSIWGIPWLSTKVAYALPAEVNSYIAQGTLETLDKRVFNSSKLEPERKLELTKAFNDLIPEDKLEFSYKLEFRSGGFIGANAFALPDGTIVVTDELVNLANQDKEIMSVLLHEIGHVEYRHGLRGIINHAGLTALVLTLTGDVNSAGTLVLALPNVLLESSYSRELEWEADTYSLEYMQKNNIEPEHFANFMQRLENYSYEDHLENGDETADNECPKNDEITASDIFDDTEDTIDNEVDSEENVEVDTDLGWLNYISSHPPSKERIARFRK
ncbi:MAG: M48 family metallopeptidase [Proteobacteria bacterium]|nr:peptidase M48 Ste24p [Pseudomonadota bacterium]NOG60978.1 M48 family metallopeptidase [Pseudomonadota bacterium]